MKTTEQALEEFALGEIKFDGGSGGKSNERCDLLTWNRDEFQNLLLAIEQGRHSLFVKMILPAKDQGVVYESDVLWLQAREAVNWESVATYGLIGTRIPILQAIRASNILDLSVLSTYERLNIVLFRAKDWFKSHENDKLQGLRIP